MAENCASLTDSYLLQLLGRIDLKGAESLSDMGYGPGTISLALTRKTPIVYGTDYSQGILSVATRRAAQTSARHVQRVQWAWKEHWDDSPQYDIAVTSRSTLVADMRQTMTKLNNRVRLRARITHLVSSPFVPSTVQRALGHEVIELPSCIYALNVLYQMGIHAHVDFIRGPNCQRDDGTWTRFLGNVCWSTGEPSANEAECLGAWY